MKIKISDMMDQMEFGEIDLQERDNFSPQRIREKTLEKIHNAPTRFFLTRKIPRAGIAIAALVCCFSITVAAGGLIKWSGFTYMDGLNRQEKEALLKEAGTAYAGMLVDERDGSVHYLDKDGHEIMALSADEAAEYETARREAAEQAVIESTFLIDVSTMPLIPPSITEVETAEDGQFADFMLGNGHMILLHPAGEAGYRLEKGDTVTIMLDADQECYLEFGVYLNGDFTGTELSRMRQHCYQYTAAEEGLYHFSVTYDSAGAGMFQDCSITVE
ncbi:MAG: hypothetical protein NC305_05590 [Lachnospiraceae bacterium]|nr:hypothetical protein [Butyrivibrio sp.]MCM1342734.1 hypothetical protein [Muribaculaceae bacterium]MCM1410002.1 hypothetical protein [Lachnospiraceae bacterium]